VVQAADWGFADGLEGDGGWVRIFDFLGKLWMGEVAIAGRGGR
jgi:hypothetical protein